MQRLLNVCAATLLFAAVANAGPMTPGKWQISTDTEIEGTPRGAPRVVTQCVTAEEAEKLQPPRSLKSTVGCEVRDLTVKGRIVTWSLECKRPDVSGAGKMMYNDDTFSGQQTMRLRKSYMVQTFTGKRLGACDHDNQEERK
jgi:hypothetical protein